ncbi:MAG: radical SAM protein [archaeon]
MSDITLVYPKTGMDEFARQPLSIMAVASPVINEGYSVEMVDTRVEDKYLEKVLASSKNGTVIGISAMTGTQISHGIRIAKAVREENPNIPIVWGGVHPSLLPKQTLEHEYVDYVVVGEGEQTFLELVRKIEKGEEPKNVDGVGYSKGKKLILNRQRAFLPSDELDILPWDLIDFKKYVSEKSGSVIAMQTSRGCPFRCTYCYNCEFNKRSWRAMSAERFVEELDAIRKETKIGKIIFWDDNFFVNLLRSEDIIKTLQDQGIGWEADIRPDLMSRLKEDFLNKMRDSKCTAVFLGAESGSQRILDFVKKDTKVEQIVKSVQYCKQYGISPILSFMTGFPTETPEERAETTSLMTKLQEIDDNAQVALAIFTPFPGTELYETSKEHGFVPPDSLEKWAEYVPTSTIARPWLSEREKVFLQDLAMISRLAFQFSRMEGFLKNPLLRYAGYLLHKFEQFRWRRQFWALPVEIRAIQYIYRRRTKAA